MESMNETLHQMWDARPVRLPREQGSEAKFLGVCEGIGVRYQIDPTLVRIFLFSSLFRRRLSVISHRLVDNAKIFSG